MLAAIETPLDVAELRVLGSLVEKEFTTPDSYPLTLNALVAACNQTSNREPVLALDQATVAAAVAGLTRRALAREVHRSDSRARRYRHLLSETCKLHPAEIAVLGVLLLRGPQTVGELRSRTARMFEFPDLKHVEITLGALLSLPQPLVALLPRRPGKKEQRYPQLPGRRSRKRNRNSPEGSGRKAPGAYCPPRGLEPGGSPASNQGGGKTPCPPETWPQTCPQIRFSKEISAPRESSR